MLSPRILGSSGRALLDYSSFDKEWSSTQHSVITFVYTNSHELLDASMLYRNFYISGRGIFWLLSLTIKLIKGKFHLFFSSTAVPEHFITFIVSKLLRKPIIILDSHWCWPKTFLAKLLWPIARFNAAHASFLAVPSKRVKKFWEAARIKQKRVIIYHYYYSSIKITEETLNLAGKLERKIAGNRIVILYFGRLIREKGVGYLIKAFSKLSKHNKNVLLLIVGDGPDKINLQNLCRNIGLKNVIFKEAVWDEHLKSAYFLLCDIFVYPSVFYTLPEEWGLAVNEAMSAGKPIIVTNAVGCCYELVKQGKNGFIVPEKNIDALYNALKSLVDDGELRIKMGNASKEIIQKFTYYNAQKILDEIIKNSLTR